MAALCVLLSACAANAQVRIVNEPRTPAPTPEAAASDPVATKIIEARRLLAAKRPEQAQKTLDGFLGSPESAGHPMTPEAYYLRGNAKLARGEEGEALRDYEEIVKNHGSSEFFPLALEREMDVAKLYLKGRRKKSLGLRIDSGIPLAEEILLRVNERLPGSKLAERALMELADFYARTRDLPMAAEAYDVFVRAYPRSSMHARAMERRVYATVAQFKGPRYDASMLKDAAVQVEEFRARHPAAAQESGMTDALVARLDESAAAAMLTTARWYIKRDDPVSARLTLSRLVRRHPRTGAAQDALTMLQDLEKQLAPKERT
jgi:outer membrane protein assembly factor BamD (BamD/ComL family)